MMTGPDTDRAPAPDTVREASRVRVDIEASRLELQSLRQEVASVRLQLAGGHTGSLQEANENLVLAVLAAQRSAEASKEALRAQADAADRDSLTGLPVAAVLRTRLATLIAREREHPTGRHVAVVLLSLTDFQRIHDTLGQVVGAQVLQVTAHNLAAAVRPGDTVSRRRRHEFLILLPHLADLAEAGVHAAAITEALGLPVQLGDQVLRLTASVGIGIFPEDGGDADSLIDHAAAAMAHATRSGPGALAFQGDTEVAARSSELRALDALGRPRVDGSPPPAVAPGQPALLQEANTRLLLAALTAQDLQEAAERALRKQTTFLGVVAHELRNPLTPIRNAASLLGRIPAGGPLLSKVQGIIERQVQNMSRLVEDLLDVSRANSGKLRLEMASVDMDALVDEVVQSARPAMEAREQLFEVHLAGQPVPVRADAVRMMQVVGNLLDNASKYTPEGGHIRLDLVVHLDEMLLTVVDNGIGISPEALPAIFDPFMQEQHATLFNGSGLGIGLTVVRELVEGHGGKVEVSSGGKGLGSRFCVTLPLERPAASTDQPL